ncbi:MAG: DUF6250 domain-containing protein, partial [Verrucomicrobiales bacterium]
MSRLSTKWAAVAMMVGVVGNGGGFAMAQDEPPHILGRGVGRFEVGKLLEEESFEDLERWAVQVEAKEGAAEAKISVDRGSLDCYVPGRGCTIWFRRLMSTRVAICYDVVCPTPEKSGPGMMPRDLNHFWMATDPEGPAEGLFDSDRYDGSFGSYDKMRGYYASTGGGRNTTTRMRRYPREIDGRFSDHIALKARDGQPEFLIIPDRVMRVQLVAYDDLIQYIVDGTLVYEMARGDTVSVESRNPEGKAVALKKHYDTEEIPFYQEGYFGFRMVGTHHVYSNFRVHELVPAKKRVEVDSIEQLRAVGRDSHQFVVM